MPPNFILSEIMLKSYIGHEIIPYENMLFTTHLQVLQPYIRIQSEQTLVIDATYHVHSVHDFPDVYNAIPRTSLHRVASAAARVNRPPKGIKRPVHRAEWPHF